MSDRAARVEEGPAAGAPAVPQLPPSWIGRRAFFARAAAVAGSTVAAGRIVSAVRPQPARAETTSTPTEVPQWAMVIDLARCDGCKECTKACQTTHFTGDQEWITVLDVTDEGGGHYFLPRPCMQCENAPCLNVCPVGATFRNENGTVLIDHDICIGCRFCMAACPYGARSFNWTEPDNPPGASLATYTPEFPVPHRIGTPDKCMFCAHDAEVGKLPACVSACPMSAIWFGDLVRDIATNGLETVKLSWLLSSRSAFRLKEELGTRPRVWYLPGDGQDASEVTPV
jgi:molybdopterin-containing oxidoreductase family iron-sulfur binding subunit